MSDEGVFWVSKTLLTAVIMWSLSKLWTHFWRSLVCWWHFFILILNGSSRWSLQHPLICTATSTGTCVLGSVRLACIMLHFSVHCVKVARSLWIGCQCTAMDKKTIILIFSDTAHHSTHAIHCDLLQCGCFVLVHWGTIQNVILLLISGIILITVPIKHCLAVPQKW